MYEYDDEVLDTFLKKQTQLLVRRSQILRRPQRNFRGLHGCGM